MSTVIESLLVSLGFDANTSGANGFMGAMDGVVGKAMAVATVIGGLFTANTFIETASTFEQFEVQLTTIQGSSEKAKESLAWISEFAAKTPYEMQQVTDAFVKLQSYGMDARKGGLLESIGNMASGMGKDLDQAVEAIADAMTGENERLKEFGIRSEKDKKTGGTTYKYNIDGKELTKTATSASQDIQHALQEIMDERFKGGMEAMSKTWKGTLSNLSDTWQMFKLKVMNAGVFDALKGKLNDFMSWLRENGDAIDEWASTIGSGVTTVINVIDHSLTTLKNFADDLGITEPLLKLLGATAIYAGLALTGLAFGGMLQATIAMGRLAIATLAATWPFALIGAAVAGLILIIDDYIGYTQGKDSVIGRLIKEYPQFKTIIDGFSQFSSHIKVLGEYATDLIEDMKGIFNAVFDVNNAGGLLGDMFGFAFDRIAEAIKALVPIFGVIIFAIGFIIKGWLMLAAVVAGVIATIITGLAGFIAYIFGAVANAIQWLANLITTVIPNAITGATEWFKNSWNGAIDYVSSLLDSLIQKWETVKGWAEKAKNFIGFGDSSQAKGQPSIPYKQQPPGSTTVNQSVSVTVPTGTAAGAAVREMGNSAARGTVKKYQAAVKQ